MRCTAPFDHRCMPGSDRRRRRATRSPPPGDCCGPRGRAPCGRRRFGRQPQSDPTQARPPTRPHRQARPASKNPPLPRVGGARRRPPWQARPSMVRHGAHGRAACGHRDRPSRRPRPARKGRRPTPRCPAPPRSAERSAPLSSASAATPGLAVRICTARSLSSKRAQLARSGMQPPSRIARTASAYRRVRPE